MECLPLCNSEPLCRLCPWGLFQILVCVIDVSYSLPVRELAEGAPRGNSDLHCRRAACWYGIFLSRQLRAAFSGGEIHSLGRLRHEGHTPNVLVGRG